MNLCIDCKHIREPDNKRFEKCNAPQNMAYIDPVNGRETRAWVYCETLRSGGFFIARMFGRCGSAGRWFEPVGAERKAP